MGNRIKICLVIISLLLYGACKVSQPLKVSDFPIPDEFRLPDSLSKNLDSTLISRKDFFSDTSLVHLIEKAFQNNFDVRVAAKEEKISEAAFKESKAAFYPDINLNLFTIEKRWFSRNSRNSPSGGWYDHKGTNPPKDLFLERSDYYSNPALDWEVDIWGKLRNQKKAAAAFYQGSKIAKRAIQTEMIASIADDYYTLQMLDEQYNVALKNREFRDSTLNMIELLYNAGEVSALAVQQSQTQVMEAATLMSQLQEERAIKENDLRLLVGGLSQKINRSSIVLDTDTSYKQVDSLPLYLVQNRPDILLSQYDLIAANAKVGVTQAQRLPNLSISIDGGVESLLSQNWFNVPGSLFGALLGGALQPVFNGRKLKTNYEIALLERDESEINFQRKVYEAIVDIKNALISIKNLKEQLLISTIKQRVAQKSVEDSRMLFRSGFANYLEVITAQGEALNSELELVKTKANLLIARIQLYRALGGGWK